MSISTQSMLRVGSKGSPKTHISKHLHSKLQTGSGVNKRSCWSVQWLREDRIMEPDHRRCIECVCDRVLSEVPMGQVCV